MNNDNDIMSIAKVASKFWADKITFPNLDNQNDVSDYLDSLLLQAKLQNTLAVTNEKKARFELELRNIIFDKLQKTNNLTIYVDYSGDEILTEALEKAGLENVILPWKTVMWIEGLNISVREGYGSEIKEIYSSNRYSYIEDENKKQKMK